MINLWIYLNANVVNLPELFDILCLFVFFKRERDVMAVQERLDWGQGPVAAFQHSLQRLQHAVSVIDTQGAAQGRHVVNGHLRNRVDVKILGVFLVKLNVFFVDSGYHMTQAALAVIIAGNLVASIPETLAALSEDLLCGREDDVAGAAHGLWALVHDALVGGRV